MFGRSFFLFLPALLAMAGADGQNNASNAKSIGTWNGTAGTAASSVGAGWNTSNPGDAAAFAPVSSVPVIVHNLHCLLLTPQRMPLSARVTLA